MVHLNNDGFSIEIKSENPIDEWLTLIDEMLDLVQNQQISKYNDRYIALGFIRELLPDNSNELTKICNVLSTSQQKHLISGGNAK